METDTTNDALKTRLRALRERHRFLHEEILLLDITKYLTYKQYDTDLKTACDNIARIAREIAEIQQSIIW